MKKLWCDLRSDAERSDYILSGQAYDAGIIAHAIQADVAMAFHRCSEYDAEVRRLREENERKNRLFADAVSALAAIDAALGMPEDGCNSTDKTITAIKLMHAVRVD